MPNLINHEPDNENSFLYAKDPYEAKYHYLINKWEDVETKYFNDSKSFIEYSNNMNNIYKNTEEYNSNKIHEILIVFDHMIVDMHNNKKCSKRVTNLFIRGKKLNISLVFIMQSYFKIPKNVRLNTTQFLFLKFQIKENLNKLCIIIDQILTRKTS